MGDITNRQIIPVVGRDLPVPDGPENIENVDPEGQNIHHEVIGVGAGVHGPHENGIDIQEDENGAYLQGDQSPPPPPAEGGEEGGEENNVEEEENGPVAMYYFTLSQVMSLVCLARAVSEEEVKVEIGLMEMIQHGSQIYLSRAQFEKLFLVSALVNSTMLLLRNGVEMNMNVRLGDMVYITVRHKFPMVPLEIRKYRRNTNGRRVVTPDGICLTQGEWQVFYNMMVIIKFRLSDMERESRMIYSQISNNVRLIGDNYFDADTEEVEETD